MNSVDGQARNSEYFSLIKELLLPGEQIALIVRQIRIWPAVSLNSVVKPKIIFATDKRVIIVARPSLGLKRSVSIFPYTIIRAIEVNRGLRLYTISISHEGNVADTPLGAEQSLVNGISHDDAIALEKYINEQIDALGPHDNQRDYPQNESAEVRVESIGKIKCPSCGFLNESGHEYCYHCGRKL